MRNGPGLASACRMAGPMSHGFSTRTAGTLSGLRQLRELERRVRQVEAEREIVLLDPLLAPVLVDVQLQQPVRPVVADHELDVDVVPGRGPQRLDGVHRSAVAAEREDRLVGIRQLDADAARETRRPASRRASGNTGPCATAADSARPPANWSAPRRRRRRRPVSCAASSSMKRDIFIGHGVTDRAVLFEFSLRALAAFSLPACSIRACAPPLSSPRAACASSASPSSASESFGSATMPRSTGWFFAIS